MIKKIIAIFSIFGVFLMSSCTKKAENLDAILKKSEVSLLDVRESEELENEGRIESAVHIPMGEVEVRINEIKAMPRPIVVFCRSGRRAEKVITILKEKGLEGIHNGGSWKNVKNKLEF